MDKNAKLIEGLYAEIRALQQENDHLTDEIATLHQQNVARLDNEQNEANLNNDNDDELTLKENDGNTTDDNNNFDMTGRQDASNDGLHISEGVHQQRDLISDDFGMVKLTHTIYLIYGNNFYLHVVYLLKYHCI